jgi:hypothetical protein
MVFTALRRLLMANFLVSEMLLCVFCNDTDLRDASSRSQRQQRRYTTGGNIPSKLMRTLISIIGRCEQPIVRLEDEKIHQCSLARNVRTRHSLPTRHLIRHVAINLTTVGTMVLPLSRNAPSHPETRLHIMSTLAIRLEHTGITRICRRSMSTVSEVH